jgi:protein O-GlcNAc transferase
MTAVNAGNRANELLQLAFRAEQSDRLDVALTHYRSLLAIDAEHPGALLRVAQSLRAAQRIDDAVPMLQTAVRSARQRGLASQSLPIHSELIIALRDHDVETRLTAIRDAQRDCGEVPGLIWEECECLRELGMRQDRLLRLNRLAALQPKDRFILAELGLALLSSNSAPQAMKPMREAIAQGYDDDEFSLKLAAVEAQNDEMASAVARVDELRAKNPNPIGALGLRWHLASQCCDWATAALLESTLLSRIDQGETHDLLTPWRLLASNASPVQLRNYARAWSRNDAKTSKPLFEVSTRRSDRSRIRVGYLSSDFHQHATALLMSGLFAAHDRTRFEIYAYSYGARVEDGYRSRLKLSFDQWHELNDLSDVAAAQLIADGMLDVLIELKGHTYGARPGIAALRPAPVQAHYLGYPGTLALDGIDYFIADATTVPVEHEPHFSETIVRLDGCYQANDEQRSRPIAATRHEMGLQENAIILCNFNQPWKWRREFVDIWLGALTRNAATLLWLLDPGKDHPAKQNIEVVASQLNVCDRIVWAPSLPPEKHLARLAIADLTLDQLPCNSHTTAADALWMGVPVLTCIGDRFDGRVAASLLHCAELAALVTANVSEYEATLARFLNDASFRLGVREIAQNAHRSRLFDTKRFAREWEHMLENLARDATP